MQTSFLGSESASKTDLFAGVSIEAPLRRGQVLDYKIPPALFPRIETGSIVQVPLRNRFVLGVVTCISKDTNVDPKKIKSLPDEQPSLPVLKKYQLDLLLWTCKNFACSLGSLLSSLLPKQVREEQKEALSSCVRRLQSKEKIRMHILAIRNKKPAQAAILDYMLKVRSQVTLQELLEKTGSSRLPLKTLDQEKWLEIFHVPKFSERSCNYSYITSNPKKLNQEQKAAVDKICAEIVENSSSTHLLFGVTGSGKTEVFLFCMAQALALNKKVLYLVPEIALTPQTTDRVRARFPDAKIALWHSGLTAREKQAIYQNLLQEKIDIVIGARSAILIPMDALGIIIIDEEHDSSYKSQSFPYIHVRDLSQKRAELQSCPLILASATPSMESLYQCAKSKNSSTKIHLLRARAQGSLPEIEVVEKPQKNVFSPRIINDLRDNFLAGNQSIIFLNRRGFFHFARCKLCKTTIKCPHCDISVTWHQSERAWHCHICHYQNPILPNCPKCAQNAFITKCGCGTEQLELAIRKALPQARCLRIDRDSCTNARTLHQKLSEFRTAKADILIGTQMVCKGHHFPLVTRCCIVDADSELAFGDFRATENFMQQLTQISGRAGRGFENGKVWIQSDVIDKEMESILLRHDYGVFAKKELTERKNYFYPPFGHLVHCLVASKRPGEAEEFANQYASILAKTLPSDAMVSDPAPSVRARLHDRYRWSILIKAAQRESTVSLLEQALAKLTLPSSCTINLDIDALDLS